jgi:hypothetical protein
MGNCFYWRGCWNGDSAVLMACGDRTNQRVAERGCDEHLFTHQLLRTILRLFLFAIRDSYNVMNLVAWFILEVKHATCALQVNIAQRLSIQRAHHIPVSYRLQIKIVHLNRIVKPSISTRGLIEDGNGTSNGFGLVEVQRLP